MDVRSFNRAAWDRQVEQLNEWAIPATSTEIASAKAGRWKIFLTPTKPLPYDWLPPLKDLKILCLASSGGQQAPILAAAGANVTVFDNSPKQLAQDQMVASREGLSFRTLEGDMADLGVFDDGVFDAIVHPVSNVFVPNVLPVWKECFRVLRQGGVLLAGFNNPVVHLIDYEHHERTGKLEVKFSLPYSDLEALSEEQKNRCEAKGTPLEFGHSLDDQIGGQISSGFVITGFYEDRDRPDTANPLVNHMPMYIATRAGKPK